MGSLLHAHIWDGSHPTGVTLRMQPHPEDNPCYHRDTTCYNESGAVVQDKSK